MIYLPESDPAAEVRDNTNPCVSYKQLSSGFFVRLLGLERWTAQSLLAEIAERGLPDREGKTSGTEVLLGHASGATSHARSRSPAPSRPHEPLPTRT
ncbi:hypothetical protein ENSA7_01560 [Enhygromyxa salina]|uniref:Uncharacterized protein n=2 Tax=Enhygromyxa salina TaxID=215803 RepID=A0A2S9YYE5_9BACT|nr:hypothetical protein ENSA7_01560 [Enhygromyxa salina]